MGNVLAWKEALHKGYSPWLYSYSPEHVPVGCVLAILDFKIWAKKVMGISCYFSQVDANRKFQLTVYLHPCLGSYRITKESIDFSSCPIDRIYQIKISMHLKKGRVFEGISLN